MELSLFSKLQAGEGTQTGKKASFDLQIDPISGSVCLLSFIASFVSLLDILLLFVSAKMI